MDNAQVRAAKDVWINDLVAAGFRLAPYLEGENFPRVGAFDTVKYDPTVTGEDIPFGYGVILDADHCVIDVDPRNFKDGVDSFLTLMADIGYTPEQARALDTYKVKTGGGGFHVFFRKDPEQKLKKNLFEGRGKDRVNIYPGIDILSKGCQVVGAGSPHHKTGNIYEVIHGHPTRLAKLPEGIYALFGRNDGHTAREGDWDDSEWNQQRFIDWLEHVARPSVSGQQGTLLALSTAHYGREMGLTEPITLALMEQYWNPHCVPPFTEHELYQKVASAYNVATSAVGSRNPITQHADEFANLPVIPDDEAYRMTQRRLLAYQAEGLRWDFKYKMVGGKPVAVAWENTLANVLNHFRWKDQEGVDNPLFGLLRYNELTESVEFTRKAFWHDEYQVQWNEKTDTNALRLYINEHMSCFHADMARWCPPKDLLWEGVGLAAQMQSYHPIRDYLKSLKWDGVKRVDKLFHKYAGAEDNLYTQAVSRCLLVAMVARAMWKFNPNKPNELGCKFDNMVILEGPQYLGKSPFCQILGGLYTVEISSLEQSAEKAIAIDLQEAWVGEVAEMTHTKKAQVEWVKAFLSKVSDKYRSPYDKVSRQRPRHFVLIGTFNPGDESGYLHDQTGNRRFWPIRCTKILLRELENDRNQLFAEAYEMYLAGKKWHITDPEVLKQAQKEQLERTVKDSWTEAVSAWLENEEERGELKSEYSREFILSTVLNIPVRDQTNYTATRVSATMRQLGWERKRKGREQLIVFIDEKRHRKETLLEEY